jgi:hypothetical protein
VSGRGPFHYRAEVIEALGRHGIRPGPDSPPELVRGYVRELYKYEIRRLRAQMLRREFPRHEYADRVGRLRERYAVLSLLPGQYLAGD